MLIGVTGFIAGSIHVWSGPDHLSAIAPLAVRRRRNSWLAGFRWGLGHSAGVLLVGLLSLWLRGLIPVAWLSHWGERLVGVMLIGIGLWGFRSVLQKHVHTHSHSHDGEDHVHVHVHVSAEGHDDISSHRHLHLAFGIGVLHGLAGSSHFLGILPALAFPTLSEALIYIVSFGIGTIASMAVFAALMGRLAGRLDAGTGRPFRFLQSCCASAALAVGCFWLFV